MNILFLIGASGCGKTTLAENIAKFDSNNFKRIIQYTTRDKRKNETQDVDYHFVAEEEYNDMKKDMFETLEYQFLPGKYGALEKDLDPDKWNIVVVSLEGFLSCLRHFRSSKENNFVMINIILDRYPEAQREGRDPLIEQNNNLGVLYNMKNGNYIDFSGCQVYYYEIALSSLIEIRNNQKLLLDYLRYLFKNIQLTTEEKILQAKTYEDLKQIFEDNFSEIYQSQKLLDTIGSKAEMFNHSIKNICSELEAELHDKYSSE
jgi:ABC-type dipeptide/oligopeptide/nickel transport system ATPase component